MAHRFYDRVTGDELTLQEHIAWKAQGLIRTPWFIGAFTLGTLLAWLSRDATILLWWNLCASALAIYVEYLVGTAMFGQTHRDATYIRRIARLEEINQVQLAHLETILGKLEAAAGPAAPEGRQDSLHREALEAPEWPALPGLPRTA